MSSSADSPWAKVRLGDIGHSLIGLTYSPANVRSSGTLVLRSSNIQDGRLVFDDNVYVDSDVPEKIRLRGNDILICVRNGSRGLIGKSVLLDQQVAGQTFGAFMAVFRSEANAFLRYFFQSDDFRRQIDEHLGATINQITNASLNGFVVALPSPAEQRAIASRLADADHYIAALERMIAKKQAIQQGMMQQLLTGKTRLLGFRDQWRDITLGDVLTVRHGKSQRAVESPRGPYPILASGGQIGWAKTPLYSKPSVLIGRKGTIDRPQYMASPFWTVDTLFYTEIEVSVDPRYLYYVFLTIDWRSMNEASGVPSLSARRVEGVHVRVPTLEEQRAIREVLDDTDAEIGLLQRHLEKARNIKQGLMQELLTGRTRLPIQEPAA